MPNSALFSSNGRPLSTCYTSRFPRHTGKEAGWTRHHPLDLLDLRSDRQRRLRDLFLEVQSRLGISRSIFSFTPLVRWLILVEPDAVCRRYFAGMHPTGPLAQPEHDTCARGGPVPHTGHEQPLRLRGERPFATWIGRHVTGTTRLCWTCVIWMPSGGPGSCSLASWTTLCPRRSSVHWMTWSTGDPLNEGSGPLGVGPSDQ